MIRRWLQERREEREAESHMRGYCYAAGALLRANAGDPEHLGYVIDRLEREADGFDKNEFDRGITLALRDWEELTK